MARVFIFFCTVPLSFSFATNQHHVCFPSFFSVSRLGKCDSSCMSLRTHSQQPGEGSICSKIQIISPATRQILECNSIFVGLRFIPCFLLFFPVSARLSRSVSHHWTGLRLLTVRRCWPRATMLPRPSAAFVQCCSGRCLHIWQRFHTKPNHHVFDFAQI